MLVDLFASNTNTSFVCSTCSWSLAKITANAFFVYYFLKLLDVTWKIDSFMQTDLLTADSFAKKKVEY